MCEERDRLWAAYDAALRTYIAAVNLIVSYGGGHSRVERAAVDDSRAQIKTHCGAHGCDPDWMAQVVPPPETPIGLLGGGNGAGFSDSIVAVVAVAGLDVS
jgi:hypothetical protein